MSNLNSNNNVSSITIPLDKFDYFHKFPIELRLKIWGHAAGDPITINAKFDFEPEYHKGAARFVTDEKGQKAKVTKEIRCFAPRAQDILALRGACTESRKEAKKLKWKYTSSGMARRSTLDTIFLDVLYSPCIMLWRAVWRMKKRILSVSARQDVKHDIGENHPKYLGN